MYRIDHNGQNPTCMQDLTKYGDRPKLYVCPDGDTTPGSITNVDAWSDYILVPLHSNASPEAIQMFCTPLHHSGAGANALSADGDVVWCNKNEFTAMLKRMIREGWSTNQKVDPIN